MGSTTSTAHQLVSALTQACLDTPISHLTLGAITAFFVFNILFTMGYVVVWVAKVQGKMTSISMADYASRYLADKFTVTTTVLGVASGFIFSFTTSDPPRTLREHVHDFSILRTLLFTLISDLVFTSLHYLYHKVPFIRRLHDEHHQIKGYLDHPLFGLHAEPLEIITYLSHLVVGHWMDVEFLELLMFLSILMFHVYSAHCEVEYPWINMFFNDGITHTMHHHFPNNNYSIMFNFWDRMAGTHRCPYKQRERKSK